MSRLRAVSDGEQAPSKQMSVAEAASSGTRRDLLVAMRSRIARAVSDPNCPPRDLAALTRRLQDIAKEIEVIDSHDGDDEVGNAADTADDQFDPQAI